MKIYVVLKTRREDDIGREGEKFEKRKRSSN